MFQQEQFNSLNVTIIIIIIIIITTATTTTTINKRGVFIVTETRAKLYKLL